MNRARPEHNKNRTIGLRKFCHFLTPRLRYSSTRILLQTKNWGTIHRLTHYPQAKTLSNHPYVSHSGLLPCYIFCTEAGSQSLSAECTKYQVKQLGFGARRAPKLLVEYNSFLQLHYWTKVLEIKIWVNDSGPHSSGSAIQTWKLSLKTRFPLQKSRKHHHPHFDDRSSLEQWRFKVEKLRHKLNFLQLQNPNVIVKKDDTGQDCDRIPMSK